MTERPAVPAALDAQLTDGSTGPEERRVRRDHRPHHGTEVRRGRFGRRRRDPLPARAELQDPEVHGGDRLVAAIPSVPGGEEPAFAERGLLRPDHVGQGDPDFELLSVPQIAVVDLVAVGGDDRGIASLVQRVHHLAGRVAAGTGHRALAVHGPDLDHRRGRDQLTVHRGGSVLRVGIDRVVVADRFDPVLDDRQVHRVAGLAAAALAGGGYPFSRCADRVGHRLTSVCSAL